ncbi:cell wall protein DAN4 isoform X1 [Rhagoletis pomonella]|uniref:cell wall protein DAN4 isoform X1 n=1 Tax=Rhagoletis pomonella TaxID=28610 RepID=UPI0017805AD3|nr:cell wall protein DAN4 isoform X1 [Rhagoletis pomonella]
MKSSMTGMLLCCLLAGLWSSAYCQAARNATDDNKSTANIKDLTPSDTVATKNDSTSLKVSTETITADPTTTTQESVNTKETLSTTDQNATTTSTAAAPDQNTTTTTAPPQTTTTLPTTSSTASPNTTTTTPSTSTTTTVAPNNSTTTVAPNNSTTTVAPDNSTTTTTTTAAPPTPRPPCNHFDFPSFIGGIVLTLGILAISLVAYKFYKARNERNYHTL